MANRIKYVTAAMANTYPMSYYSMLYYTPKYLTELYPIDLVTSTYSSYFYIPVLPSWACFLGGPRCPLSVAENCAITARMVCGQVDIEILSMQPCVFSTTARIRIRTSSIIPCYLVSRVPLVFIRGAHRLHNYNSDIGEPCVTRPARGKGKKVNSNHHRPPR